MKAKEEYVDAPRETRSKDITVYAVIFLVLLVGAGIFLAVRLLHKPADAALADSKSGIIYDSSAVEGGWDNLSPEEIAEKLNEKVSLEDMKQLFRAGVGELYDYSYEDETREIEETVLNEDGEEVTELREVTVRVYTLTYRGEAYFADSIFHLTAEQKTLAQNFAENLSLFLGDGLFQNLSSSERGFTIPALGDIRYTDGSTEVVYYNQLDERYANKPYGTDDIGGYGCGPTAMAMVVSSLTDDLVDPVEMAKWSYEHGYWCSGSGSYHALIPAAAEAWGLPVSGCTASEPQRITDALSSGKMIVAIMSAGHFTSSGHFIVLRGVQDEKILVADPASRTRSEQSWDLSIILNEASKAAGSGGPFWIIG